MTAIALIIYLGDIVDGLKGGLLFVFGLSCLIFIVSLLVRALTEDIKKVKFFMITSFVFMVITGLSSALIPSKKAIYIIGGIKVIDTIVSKTVNNADVQDISKSTVNIIKNKLKEIEVETSKNLPK